MALLCRTALVVLALAGACAPALAGTCSADPTCTACDNNNLFQCTGCEPGYTLSDSDLDGRGTCLATTCVWKDDDAKDWYSKILVGSMVGAAIALITLVITSLPVCCGVMKDGNLKCIGAVVGVIAGLSLLIPFVTGAATSGQVVDDVCKNCSGGCTDKEREDIRTAISALGVYVAYTAGFGFIVVILGAISMCLACCMCCPCCGPLQEAQQAKQQGGAPAAQVVGQVVGQPQNNCS